MELEHQVVNEDIGPRELSVVICTHNPRIDVLHSVIDSLQSQSLHTSRWSLTLVDNNSDVPLIDQVDLAWHDSPQFVHEAKPGLTAARHRAIAETDGAILVFVDDDNVLDRDYLEVAAQIGNSHPMLGAWGGQLLPETPDAITPDLVDFASFIGIRHVGQARWASFPDPEATPFGAGLCVRRAVAEAYVRESTESRIRSELDVNGTGLLRCGDIDLAWTSCDLGLGVGVFPSLRLTHCLDSSRFELAYARAVVIGHEISHAMLRFARFGEEPQLPARDLVGRRQRIGDALRLTRPMGAPTPLEHAREEGMRRAHALFMRGAFRDSADSG